MKEKSKIFLSILIRDIFNLWFDGWDWGPPMAWDEHWGGPNYQEIERLNRSRRRDIRRAVSHLIEVKGRLKNFIKSRIFSAGLR